MLLSTQFGRTMAELRSSSILIVVPLAISSALLFVASVFGGGPRAAAVTPAGFRLRLLMILLFALAALSTIWVTTGNDTFLVGRTPWLKLAGLLLVIPTLLTRSRRISSERLITTLRWFAPLEMIFLLALAPISNWNPNAISTRIAICGVIGFALYRSFTVRTLLLLTSAGVSFAYRCRTATVACISAVIAWSWSRKFARRKVEFAFLSLVVLGSIVVLADPITDALMNVAGRNLGSDNLIADFFLHDKVRADLGREGDFLDRVDVWVAASDLIAENPLFGIGLGCEDKYLGLRAHNALLSATVEAGVLYGAGWGLLTVLAMVLMLNEQSSHNYARVQLARLGFGIGAYLILAGLVEASGLASVATPGSQVFYLIAFRLGCREESPSMGRQVSRRHTQVANVGIRR